MKKIIAVLAVIAIIAVSFFLAWNSKNVSLAPIQTSILTLTLIDSSTNTPLSGIPITIKSMKTSAIVSSQTTNSLGVSIFTLTNGVYEIKANGGTAYFDNSKTLNITRNNILTLDLRKNNVNLNTPPQLVPFNIQNADGTISKSKSAISPETFRYISPKLKQITFTISGTNFDKNAVVKIDGKSISNTAKVDVISNNLIEVTFQIDDYFYSFFPESKWVTDFNGGYYEYNPSGSPNSAMTTEAILHKNPRFIPIKYLAPGEKIKHKFSIINPAGAGGMGLTTDAIYTGGYPMMIEGEYLTGESCPEGLSSQISSKEFYIPTINLYQSPSKLPQVYKGLPLTLSKIEEESAQICGTTIYTSLELDIVERYSVIDIIGSSGIKKRVCISTGVDYTKVRRECDNMIQNVFSDSVVRNINNFDPIYLVGSQTALVSAEVTELIGLSNIPYDSLIGFFEGTLYKYDTSETIDVSYYTETNSGLVKRGIIQNMVKKGFEDNYQWDVNSFLVKSGKSTDYNEAYSKDFFIEYLTYTTNCESTTNLGATGAVLGTPRPVSYGRVKSSAHGRYSSYDLTKIYYFNDAEAEDIENDKFVESELDLKYSNPIQKINYFTGEPYCDSRKVLEVASNIRDNEPSTCFYSKTWNVWKDSGGVWHQDLDYSTLHLDNLRGYWHMPGDAPPYVHCWPRMPESIFDKDYTKTILNWRF